MLRLCLQLEIVTNVVKHRKKRRLTFISLNCQDFYVFNRSARWYIDRPSTYKEDSSFPTSEFPQVDPRNLGCRISGSKQKHWEHISLCLQKQEIQTLLHICNRLQSWYAWYVYIYIYTWLLYTYIIIYIYNSLLDPNLVFWAQIPQAPGRCATGLALGVAESLGDSKQTGFWIMCERCDEEWCNDDT